MEAQIPKLLFVCMSILESLNSSVVVVATAELSLSSLEVRSAQMTGTSPVEVEKSV